MRILTLIALALITSACGTKHSIDTRLETYVLQAELDLGYPITNITYRVAELVDKNGVCNTSVFGTEIVISLDTVQKGPADFIYSVLLHEIGHCFKHKEHQAGYKDGCPVSIMNSAAPSSECFKQHKQMYLDQLR